MLEHLKKLGDHIANMDSGSKDAAAIRYVLTRLGDCEQSLHIWDDTHTSEYWMRYDQPTVLPISNPT